MIIRYFSAFEIMSGVKRNGFSFTWKIENFSFCHQEYISSPYFGDENFKHITWQLVLYPKGHQQSQDDSTTNIAFELCKVVEETEIVIDFKIEIIGPSSDLLGVFKEKSAVFNEHILVNGSSLVERALIDRDISETNKDILTVCCHMSSTESSAENSTDCHARTKIIVNQQSLPLKWRHQEISTLLDKENQLIMTKCFYFPDMTECHIAFEKIVEDVQIIFYRNINDSQQCIECKISLLDVKGNQVLSMRDRHLFLKEDNLWIMPSFIPVSELKYNRNKYIKNGSMIILCEIFCSGGIESQKVFYGNNGRKCLANAVNDTLISQHTLQSDIRNLFSDKILCDVQLRVDDEFVQAHKSILGARSPVFQAMFQLDMVETQTGVVDIQDVDIDTLKSFVNFMYCDTVDNMDYDCAKNLLIVAEKYEVPHLKEICASFLKSDISKRNACEIAALADMVSHTDLKSFALDFIAGHSKNILNMPEWLPWMKNHMKLATQVFQRFSEKHILT